MLNGKVALITGASGRIGKETAVALAEKGANVVINYLTSEERASDVEREVTKYGVKSMKIRADVSESADVAKMFKAVMSSFQSIDLLVNGAGIIAYDYPRSTPLRDLSEKVWDRVMDVNLKGTYLCSKEVTPIMIRQGTGRIINIASTAGFTATPLSISYGASKAAIMQLTKSFADLLAPKILVNCVAPNYVDSEFGGNISLNEHTRKEVIKTVPARRFCKPDEIANVIAYLAEAPDYLTGVTIAVDGGYLLH